jgi:hypothetical protein
VERTKKKKWTCKFSVLFHPPPPSFFFFCFHPYFAVKVGVALAKGKDCGLHGLASLLDRLCKDRLWGRHACQGLWVHADGLGQAAEAAQEISDRNMLIVHTRTVLRHGLHHPVAEIQNERKLKKMGGKEEVKEAARMGHKRSEGWKCMCLHGRWGGIQGQVAAAIQHKNKMVRWKSYARPKKKKKKKKKNSK